MEMILVDASKLNYFFIGGNEGFELFLHVVSGYIWPDNMTAFSLFQRYLCMHFSNKKPYRRIHAMQCRN